MGVALRQWSKGRCHCAQCKPPSAGERREVTHLPAGGAQQAERPVSLPRACEGGLGGIRIAKFAAWASS